MEDTAGNPGEERSPLWRNLVLVFSYLAIMAIIAGVYA